MGEPFDFRGTVLVCNIFSVDTGKWASFSVQLGQDTIAGQAASEHLPYASNLTVNEHYSGLGQYSIVLTPPTYEEALRLLTSPWLTIGNTMSIRWGYSKHPSHISPWCHGMMLKPDISFGDDFSITIKASSFGWAASKVQSGKVWGGVHKTSPQISKKDVIEKLIKNYDFQLVVKMGTNADTEYKRKGISINQGGLNDWMFIKKLAADCGCRCFITNGNIVNIIDVTEVDNVIPFTFVYRGAFDLEKNIFPLESFDSDSTALFLPTTAVAGRFMHPNDKRNKLFKKIEANESTSKVPAISDKKVVSPNMKGPKIKGPDGKTIAHTIAPDEKGAPQYMPISPGWEPRTVPQQLQNAFNMKTAESHGISATANAPDVPSLLCGDIVTIKGVGDYFSCPYTVFKIDRSIGKEFAKMALDLRPKGISGLPNYMSIKAPVTPAMKIAEEVLKRGKDKSIKTTDKNFSWLAFMAED